MEGGKKEEEGKAWKVTQQCSSSSEEASRPLKFAELVLALAVPGESGRGEAEEPV